MGDFLLAAWIIVLLAALAIFIYGFPAMIAVGPIPSHKKGIDKALALADIKQGEKFYDLGCGDGRVLIEAVKKYDCSAIGYELVFPCCVIARIKSKLVGLDDKIKIKCRNFFKADISDADVIFCYLTPDLIKKFVKLLKNTKFKKEVRIVSYAFSIKELNLVKKIDSGRDNWNIYLYKY